MEVWKIIITTGFDRSGCWSSRWKDPQGGGVFHGEWKRKVSTLTGWLGSAGRWQEMKKPWENTCLHKHHATNNASTKQPTWTKKSKIVRKITARDEKQKHDDTNTGVCWIDHSGADGSTSGGVRWSKNKKKKIKGRQRVSGKGDIKQGDDTDETAQRSWTKQIRKCLVCYLGWSWVFLGALKRIWYLWIHHKQHHNIPAFAVPSNG